MIFIKNKFLYLFAIFVIWAFISSFYDPIILPSPYITFSAILKIITSKDFIYTIGNTFLKMLVAILFTFIVGILLGLLMGLSQNIKNLFHPLIVFLQASPVISFILLALIWFEPKTIPSFVLCINSFPNLAINVQEGINNIDKKLLQMSNFYKVDKIKLLKYFYIPSILSRILAGISIILSNSFKIIVMAEVISKSPNGIGSKINWAWLNIETEYILAWTILIIFFTYILEKYTLVFIKKLIGSFYA